MSKKKEKIFIKKASAPYSAQRPTRKETYTTPPKKGLLESFPFPWKHQFTLFPAFSLIKV